MIQILALTTDYPGGKARHRAHVLDTETGRRYPLDLPDAPPTVPHVLAAMVSVAAGRKQEEVCDCAYLCGSIKRAEAALERAKVRAVAIRAGWAKKRAEAEARRVARENARRGLSAFIDNRQPPEVK